MTAVTVTLKKLQEALGTVAAARLVLQPLKGGVGEYDLGSVLPRLSSTERVTLLEHMGRGGIVCVARLGPDPAQVPYEAEPRKWAPHAAEELSRDPVMF